MSDDQFTLLRHMALEMLSTPAPEEEEGEMVVTGVLTGITPLKFDDGEEFLCLRFICAALSCSEHHTLTLLLPEGKRVVDVLRETMLP